MWSKTINQIFYQGTFKQSLDRDVETLYWKLNQTLVKGVIHGLGFVKEKFGEITSYVH